MPKLSQVRLTKRLVDAAQPGQCLSDSEVRGFRLVVSPSGTRRFVASYRVAGKSSMKALGTFPTLTVEQARDLAREVLRDARRGNDPQETEKAARRALEEARGAPTVADLAKLYLEDYAPAQALRPNSVRHARALLKLATGALGKTKVAEVERPDIRKLHGDTRSAGIKAGTKGVYQANRLLAVLSKTFALAIERGWRTDNPCKGIPKFPEDQRWRNLKEEEVGRLLAACDDYEAGIRPATDKDTPEEAARKAMPLPQDARSATDREAANAIRLLLYTGARLNEVLRAEWSQFELEGGLWEKPSAHTKTKRQHRLELEGPALELLQAMAERKSHPVYLFPGDPKLRRKDAPVDIKTGKPKGIAPRADLRHPWRTISVLAGLEDVKLHDLRRTTASFMLSGGSSLATVGRALGHTQASTTQRYATLAPSIQREGLRDAGQRMAALKGKAGGGTVLAFPEAGK